MYQVGDRVKYVGTDGKYEDETVYIVSSVTEGGNRFNVSWTDEDSGSRTAGYSATSVKLFTLVNDQGWQDVTGEEYALLKRLGVPFEEQTVKVVRVRFTGGK